MFNPNNYSNTSAHQINTKRMLWNSLPDKEKETEQSNNTFNIADFDNLYVKFKIKSVRKYRYNIDHDTTTTINNFTLEDENTNVFNIMIMDDSLHFGYNGSIYKFNKQSNKYIRINNIDEVLRNDGTLFYYAFEKTTLPTAEKLELEKIRVQQAKELEKERYKKVRMREIKAAIAREEHKRETEAILLQQQEHNRIKTSGRPRRHFTFRQRKVKRTTSKSSRHHATHRTRRV